VTVSLLDAAAVREGHRTLLETFREFAEALDGGTNVVPHPTTLGGLVSFLRESLLPFAAAEERSITGCEELREETGFEHAFLAVEIDRLAEEVGELGRPGGSGSEREARLARVRRRVHRLEAALELHVLKAEDRECAPLPANGGPTEASRETAARTARAGDGPQRMTQAEITRFLQSQGWGILTTVGVEGPYGVPVSYGFDGRAVFIATGAGRKQRHLEVDPRVSLTVLRVTDGSRWTSVVVEGSARAVTGVGEKLRAAGILARQHAAGATLSPGDLARLRGARIFRIEPREIGGRRR
jgi:uncharacterized protein